MALVAAPADSRARLGAEPEAFVVEELPLYAPEGRGEHTFVRVEKRLCSTEEVARALARAAGVRPRDVGYAGRKDRRALSSQWLSVPGLPAERARSLEGEVGSEGVFRVLEAAPHPHKLRTGQLRGNRFHLLLREVDTASLAALPGALAELEGRGMPNRFGAQRFGREGDNAARARRILAGELAPRDRRAARFLLSALQAELFNAVLRERPLPLDAVERGDVARLHARGGLFRVEDPQAEEERLRRFEISATGPIFGTRTLGPSGAPEARERRLRRALEVPPDDELRLPRGLRLPGARRVLRVRPEELAWQSPEPGQLRLRFSLPAGSYATVLVEELFGAAALADRSPRVARVAEPARG